MNNVQWGTRLAETQQEHQHSAQATHQDTDIIHTKDHSHIKKIILTCVGVMCIERT